MDKAKGHRIQTQNRTPLQNVIPLDTPFVIYVDPSSACNFRCRFCPSGEREAIKKTSRWMGALDVDLYKKIIDDLAEFGKPIKTLKLYKDGEPLVNRHFAAMVACAKASRVADVIETTTNGSLLTQDRVDDIISAGLDRINISVYGMSDDDFIQFARTKIRFDQFVQNIRYLYAHRGSCHVHIKTTIGISDQLNIDEFYQVFGNCCDSINVEHISPFWPGYDFHGKGDLSAHAQKGTFGQVLEQKLVCPYLFYALAVNSDGQVDLCSCDWTHDYIIGDVRKQSLKEIWNSEALHGERILQLEGRRLEHPLCKHCHEIAYECIDNIDAYRGEILTRLRDLIPGNEIWISEMKKD